MRLSPSATVYLLSAVLACGDAASAAPNRSGRSTTAGMPGEEPPASHSGSQGAPVLTPAQSVGGGAPLIPSSVPAQLTRACKPGHYVGSFSGMHQSGALLGAVSVPFATTDLEDRPGFEFWLESVDSPCAPGQEFCANAVVKGGKLRGLADPTAQPGQAGLGLAVRFEIDLSGEVDCATGAFRGRLENGCYDVLSVLYRFAGTIEGTYSTAMSAFSNGSWQVEESLMAGQPMPAMPLVGQGTWSASYTDDMAQVMTGIGLCAGQSGLDTP